VAAVGTASLNRAWQKGISSERTASHVLEW
jgi:hypothetical protein